MPFVPEFVGFSKCQKNILIFRHDITSSMIHEFECTLIVGFLEPMLV